LRRVMGGGGAERTELPIADKPDRARQVIENGLHSAARQIGIGAAIHAAIGNIVQWDVCHQLGCGVRQQSLGPGSFLTWRRNVKQRHAGWLVREHNGQ
jgi:hypothetical protein